MQIIKTYLTSIYLAFIFSSFCLFPKIAYGEALEKENIEESNLSILHQSRSFNAKIAVVDVTSILEHSQAVIGIKNSIEDISQKIQNELHEKELELKKSESIIIEKRGSLPEKEFEKLVMDFNTKVSSTQQEMQKKKSALEKAHAEAIDEVHKNTIKVITDLSKKYDFNVVLPSSHVVFVNNALNITHEVISNLNDRLKEVHINYDL